MSTEYFIETKKITFKDKNYKENNLSNVWFAEKRIDEEYQYYKLLAYLQRIDENINNGFLFQEFFTLEKRYKDLESFVINHDIIHKDKESEHLFNFIYELPDYEWKLKEIDAIVDNSYSLLKTKYIELKLAITYLKDYIKVSDKKIIDKRKNLHVYIEMCNCNIIEHYTVSKKGNIVYNGSFYLDTPTVEDNENNYYFIKTDIAMNNKGITIPYLLKIILSKN